MDNNIGFTPELDNIFRDFANGTVPASPSDNGATTETNLFLTDLDPITSEFLFGTPSTAEDYTTYLADLNLPQLQEPQQSQSPPQPPVTEPQTHCEDSQTADSAVTSPLSPARGSVPRLVTVKSRFCPPKGPRKQHRSGFRQLPGPDGRVKKGRPSKKEYKMAGVEIDMYSYKDVTLEGPVSRIEQVRAAKLPVKTIKPSSQPARKSTLKSAKKLKSQPATKSSSKEVAVQTEPLTPSSLLTTSQAEADSSLIASLLGQGFQSSFSCPQPQGVLTNPFNNFRAPDMSQVSSNYQNDFALSHPNLQSTLNSSGTNIGTQTDLLSSFGQGLPLLPTQSASQTLPILPNVDLLPASYKNLHTLSDGRTTFPLMNYVATPSSNGANYQLNYQPQPHLQFSQPSYQAQQPLEFSQLSYQAQLPLDFSQATYQAQLPLDFSQQSYPAQQTANLSQSIYQEQQPPNFPQPAYQSQQSQQLDFLLPNYQSNPTGSYTNSYSSGPSQIP